jgi:hypothetical protein
LRRIRDIADKADLSLERVFRDVLAIGVSVISDPAESPYTSLIAFRSGLQAKQAELEHDGQSVPASKAVPDTGLGSPSPSIGQSVLADSFDQEAQNLSSGGDEGPDRAGLDVIDERSGLETQDGAGDVLLAKP